MKSILIFITLFLSMTAAWAQPEELMEPIKIWCGGVEIKVLPVRPVAKPAPKPTEQPVTVQPEKPGPASLHRACVRITNKDEAAAMCPQICDAVYGKMYTGNYRLWNHGTNYPVDSSSRERNNSACECN